MISRGIIISINTNAALLDKKYYDFISQNKINLFISFPCSNEILFNKITNSNSFEKINKNLLLLKKNNISFVLNIVVSKLNLNEIEKTVKYLKDNYNVKKVCVTRVGKPVNSTDDFSKIMLSYDDMKILQSKILFCVKHFNIEIDTACPYTPCSLYSQEAFEYLAYKKVCTAGKTSYSVDCFGNVKACPRESNSYGNIFNEDFLNVWKSMKKWRDDSIIPKECKSCSEYSKCLGGCRMDRFSFSNLYDELDCISNLNNLPIKYEKKENFKKDYKESDLFEVVKSVQYLEDCDCIRVSNNKKYCYITNDFYQYIMQHTVFSPLMISKKFDINMCDVYKIIDILIINNIIAYKYKDKKGVTAYE